jgi:CRP/FNR family transcriptional regulator, cyclic AMP receptor protein
MTQPPVSTADLAGVPFTQGLAEVQVGRLAALARRTWFPEGRRIFTEGGPATRLWLITAGRVALDLQAGGPEPLIVETLGPGDELGLSWLAPVPLWQFGAVAQLDVAALEFDAAVMLALFESDHDLGYLLVRRLLNTAASRAQAARIRLLDMYAAAPHGRTSTGPRLAPRDTP